MIQVLILSTLISLQYGIPPELSLAVIQTESAFKQNAKGKHGEIGLMQLKPKFFPHVTYDIHTNLQTGIAYLAEVKRGCKRHKSETWIICYNKGPKSGRRIKDPASEHYYRKVSSAICQRASVRGQSPLRFCKANQEALGQK